MFRASLWLVSCMSSCCFVLFFFKQKTAYEMRISDWSSDVCSSDLRDPDLCLGAARHFSVAAVARRTGAQDAAIFGSRARAVPRRDDSARAFALDRKSVV